MIKTRYMEPYKEEVFANLRRANYHVTSSELLYNCIAYAADRTDVWWWPQEVDGASWPDDVPFEETLEAFECLFRNRGYERCEDGQLAEGFEKIAIYTD